MYRQYRSYDLTPLWVLIGFTSFIWLLTAFGFFPQAFRLFGVSRITFTGQPWTIITALFLHGDFGHILSNMITLYFFGSFILSLMSWQKAALIYFVGGIIGNLLFLLLSSPLSLAVGASGAIFTLGGALAVLRPRVPVMVFPIPTPIPLWLAVLGGFVLISLMQLASFLPNVAQTAHLGGLLFGLVVGYYLRNRGY